MPSQPLLSPESSARAPADWRRAMAVTVVLACCVLAGGGCSTPAAGGFGANADGLGGDGGAQFGDGSNGDGNNGDGDGGDGTADDASDGAATTTDANTGSCTDGEKGCLGQAAVKWCVAGKWELLDACQGDKICKDGACAIAADCKPGIVDGCAGYTARRVCTDDGKGYKPVDCDAGELCVQGVCKVVDCVPGTKECATESQVRECKADGSGWQDATDCKTGAYCLGGTCVSLCEQNSKVASNVGCDYWTVDLDNADDGLFGLSANPMHVPHSVVVSNPGIYDAELVFQVQPPWKIVLPTNIVPAGKSIELKMPVMNVDGNELSAKAIYFKSTQPVVAYQFNPFNADKAFSNDGSLLLPQNALGKEYYAVSLGSRPDFAIPGMPAMPSQNGYFTVVATTSGETTVTVTLSGKGYVKQNPVTKLPINKGQTVSFKMQQYDVLNLEAYSQLPNVADLTGSHIVATQPVAVFGGHEEAVLGWSGGGEDSCCAEHVEEQLLPVQAWGKSYVLPKTAPRGSEADLWIVMASLPGTKVTTNPPINGLDGHTFQSGGQWVQVESTESFTLEATGPVQVAQFIVSQQQTDDWIGDPTMIVHSPMNQMRKDYFILTPVGYSKNYVSVLRVAGAEVKADGLAIAASEFKKVGDGTWELAYHSVTPGLHRFETSATAFGLSVYGYGNATAYGYPGGMNLQ